MEYQKSQIIRLYDVLFIGPFLLYAAYKYRNQLSDFDKITLSILGIATIGYNLNNYLKNIKSESI